ncbi:MAG: MFS transporter [Selenomonas sp.]|uniref:MFS transporter n=1 Tax=Selenomonas sp. TaxID=2053611 RepID=UPI0025FE0D95|nr:MFS transporter [Selenomonas sp.]MCI6233201.1 MFS transporter [Selenomonas sp.]
MTEEIQGNRSWKVVLAILVCNILFMSASYTMIIPFLPLYLAEELGAAPEHVNLWSGVVFSASFVVSAVMAPIWGRMADTRGKRLMAMRASLLLAVSYFLGGIVQSPEELVGMRMFQGFASGLWPMDLAIMTLYAPSAKLGLCLGIMQGVMTAGGVVGPLFGGVLATAFGMRMSFFLAAGALFVNFLMFVFLIKEPPASVQAMEKQKEAPKAQPKIWHMPLLRDMLLCGTLVSMIIMILQPVLTTYIAALAGDIPNIVFVAGLVFSLGGIAGAITAPIWGKLGQRKGFFRVMALAMVCAGVGLFVQGIPDTLVPFAVMQFTCSMFLSGIHPAINAVLAENSSAEIKGRIFGYLFSAQQVGSMAGPILGGVVATCIGMHAVFYVAGSIMVLLSLAVWGKYVRA